MKYKAKNVINIKYNEAILYNISCEETIEKWNNVKLIEENIIKYK